MKTIKEIFSVNKYYKMSDARLESEAAKWNIKGYGSQSGIVNRQIIIDALLKKQAANDSRLAISLAAIALLISIIAIIT